MNIHLFEMRLTDIYQHNDWLHNELSDKEFVALFPVSFKKGRALLPEMPVGYDLNRNIFLQVLVAFRQSFH